MLDPLLGKLILRRISVDHDTCEQALLQGVVTIIDLDPKNEVHVEGVDLWLENIEDHKLAPIPVAWLSVLKAKQIMRLAAIMPQAITMSAKAIRDGYNIEKLVWNGPTFPTAWAKAIEKTLLETPRWDAFHAVQDKLPVDMSARLRTALAVKITEKEKKEKEEKKAYRSKMPPKVDALEVSIRKRDSQRLRKLPLAKLSKVRWEKHKDEWLKAPSEILAFAAKIPVEFYRPYEATILAAVAENNWVMLPEQTVTKSCLQGLEVQHQASFLREMFCALIDDAAFPDVEPELCWEEIRNIMVASTLQNSDNLRLGNWLDALETFKYFRSLKPGGVRLSKEEADQFRMASPAADSYLHVEGWLRGSVEDDDVDSAKLVMDLLAWAKSQPKEKHPAYGAILSNNDGVKGLFGDALKAHIKS